MADNYMATAAYEHPQPRGHLRQRRLVSQAHCHVTKSPPGDKPTKQLGQLANTFWRGMDTPRGCYRGWRVTS